MLALWMFLFAISFMLGLARLRWGADAGSLRARLRRGRERVPQPAYDPQEIRDLPPPVRRFFEAALVPGCPFIGGAALAHVGSIRLAPSFDAAFVSSTNVTVRRPGFLWHEATVAWIDANGEPVPYWTGELVDARYD